jgi:hypothetical protein
MADADEDVSHLGAQEATENDPTEETQDFRFLDKLMYVSRVRLQASIAKQLATAEGKM